MKKLLFALILFSLVISGCIQPQPIDLDQQSGNGTLKIQITDKALAELATVQKLNITISKIQVHMAGNETDANWITIMQEPKTFELVSLKDVKELLGSKELSAGKYTQIRLNVDKATATIDGNEVEITIAANEVKLINEFDIKTSQTTTLTLDFDPQESVIAAGNGEYLLKPTIKVIEETKTETIAANINFLNAPSEWLAGSPIEFKWRVVGSKPGKIEHTAIHWDTMPKPVDFREYANISEVQTGWTPQEFSTLLDLRQIGTYYVRGHAIVAGKNVYTEEIELTISAPPLPEEPNPDIPTDVNEFEQPVVRKYSITVDDEKFDPVEVFAKAGETVELTITCAEQNTYFAGARVESEYFNTGAIAVGASKTVSFTIPDKDVKMTNYWPETNVKKADG